MVSPFSTDSYEQHRQEALEKLAPPSPQDSSEALNVAFEQPQSFLPGPMSGTITDVVATEYVPEPLDLSRTSRMLLSPQEAARHAQAERLEFPTQHQFQQPDTNQSWARVMEKLNKRKSAEQREKERVLQHASQKYPGMKSPRQLRKDSSRSSGGSSITQRASNMMQVLSGSSSKSSKTPGSTSATTARRQKQLAVKTTPYQEHGPDIWLPPEKQEKKKKREEKKLQKEWDAEQKRKHQRNRSSANSKTSMGSAYQSGQNHIVGVMQRLSRSASEKRRDKLKKNIVHVGPTKSTKEKGKVFKGAGGWK
jgi:hypothetical protein